MEEQEVKVALNAEDVIHRAIEKASASIGDNPLIAEMLLRQIIKCDPEHADALALLGLTLHRLKKYVECVEVLQMAIEVDPANTNNYNNISLAYGCLEQFERAAEYAHKAVALDPGNHIFLNNLAITYREMNKIDKAIEILNQSLAIKEAAPVLANLGGAYGELKDLKNAESCLRRAIEVDPSCTGAHVDLAFTRHLKGDHAEGFSEYEWRIKHFDQIKHYLARYDQSKRWCDPKQDIFGSRMLIYAEQGMGDLIMCLRWAKKLKEKGVKEITIHCNPALHDLALSAEGVDMVINKNIVTGEGDEYPEHELHCCIFSLPYLLQDFEISGKPYLTAEPSKIKEKYPDTFNMGICWAGSPAHPQDGDRSVYLRSFRQLEVPGVKLFSLQQDTRPRMRRNSKTVVDLSEGSENMKIVDLAPYMEDFQHSASLVGGLDLVVSVDTALVHLCGALGVPCWALIPHNPDWRWGLEGEKTEWYDSVRMFRQEIKGDWEEVFVRVAEVLKKRITDYQ